MANCHKAFIEFNNAIALTSRHKVTLRGSRNAVRNKIKKYFQEKKNELTPKFHGQGSFMMNTIIKPIDGQFDIDDGIYFKVDSPPTQSIATLHTWISNAVNGHTKQKPIDKNTCVRLVYVGQYHIDLPIYYIVEGQSPYLAHKSKGWIQSDPREFINWFNQQADANGQLKRVIRYLKAWSDYRKGDLPSGLILSILVTNNISFNDRDDIAFYETLVNINESLEKDFICNRPTTPVDEDLLEDYSQTRKQYFLDRLGSFIISAEEAVDDSTSQDDACKIWKRHFGANRFIEVALEGASSNFSDKLTFAASQKPYGFNSDEYSNTEEFIEDYFSMNLTHNLKIDSTVSQIGFRIQLLSQMLAKKYPLLPDGSLKFYIKECNAIPPFEVKWKVRNVGYEAIKRDQIRGQIKDDDGNHQIIESINFKGSHYVECFIIKNNVCVARDRIDVPIGTKR
jgi:hypothetical protein